MWLFSKCLEWSQYILAHLQKELQAQYNALELHKFDDIRGRYFDQRKSLSWAEKVERAKNSALKKRPFDFCEVTQENYPELYNLAAATAAEMGEPPFALFVTNDADNVGIIYICERSLAIPRHYVDDQEFAYNPQEMKALLVHEIRHSQQNRIWALLEAIVDIPLKIITGRPINLAASGAALATLGYSAANNLDYGLMMLGAVVVYGYGCAAVSLASKQEQRSNEYDSDRAEVRHAGLEASLSRAKKREKFQAEYQAEKAAFYGRKFVVAPEQEVPWLESLLLDSHPTDERRAEAKKEYAARLDNERQSGIAPECPG